MVCFSSKSCPIPLENLLSVLEFLLALDFVLYWSLEFKKFETCFLSKFERPSKISERLLNLF